jgi:hypothetical protein
MSILLQIEYTYFARNNRSIAVSSQDAKNVAQQGEAIYQRQLKGQLEQSHCDEFVAIEPTSGDYYLGRTLSEAIGAARKAHPDRLVHAVRIGHEAAIHLGSEMQVEAIANNGQLPLLGVGLLRGHKLVIDYITRDVLIQ